MVDICRQRPGEQVEEPGKNLRLGGWGRSPAVPSLLGKSKSFRLCEKAFQERANEKSWMSCASALVSFVRELGFAMGKLGVSLSMGAPKSGVLSGKAPSFEAKSEGGEAG